MTNIPRASIDTGMLQDPNIKYVMEKCVTDFRFFAKNCIKIKTKKPGEVLDFDFNVAQEILWETRLWMLAQYGFVRLIIVKGRQQGCSTFIEMLFLWMILFTAFVKVVIISHELDSSKALMEKASFAIEQLEHTPFHQGKLKTDNTKKIELPNGSEINCITAGSEEAGRSQTAHLQHQSERAFYPDHEAIDAGAGQIVGLEPGTEVYKESTAKGRNVFYYEVKAALKRAGLFRVIFIPWFVEPKYRLKPDADFVRTEEEEELLRRYSTYTNPYTGTVYKGLVDDWQLAWRRAQIIELKGIRKFKQEYPCFLGEAFQLPGNSFFDLDNVEKAMHTEVKENDIDPLILSVDPARSGDRFVIGLRRGRKFIKKWIYEEEIDTTHGFNILAQIIDEYGPDAVFIDWAKGEGIIDMLHAKKYFMVQGVHFAGKSSNPLYANKRAEMYFELRNWLDWKRNGPVQIFNDDDTYSDLQSIPDWIPHGTKMGLVPKEKIKEEVGMSPDIADMMALSFAYPVASKRIDHHREYMDQRHDDISESTTMRDFRAGDLERGYDSGIIGSVRFRD